MVLQRTQDEVLRQAHAGPVLGELLFRLLGDQLCADAGKGLDFMRQRRKFRFSHVPLIIASAPDAACSRDPDLQTSSKPIPHCGSRFVPDARIPSSPKEHEFLSVVAGRQPRGGLKTVFEMRSAILATSADSSTINGMKVGTIGRFWSSLLCHRS